MAEHLELPPIKTTSAPAFSGLSKTPTSPEMKAVKLSNNTTKVIVAIVGLATAAVGGTALKKATDTGDGLEIVKQQVADHTTLVNHIAEEKVARQETKESLQQLTTGQQQQAIDQAELKAMLKLELKKHGLEVK